MRKVKFKPDNKIFVSGRGLIYVKTTPEGAYDGTGEEYILESSGRWKLTHPKVPMELNFARAKEGDVKTDFKGDLYRYQADQNDGGKLNWMLIERAKKFNSLSPNKRRGHGTHGSPMGR